MYCHCPITDQEVGRGQGQNQGLVHGLAAVEVVGLRAGASRTVASLDLEVGARAAQEAGLARANHPDLVQGQEPQRNKKIRTEECG